jgi:hypothetical protein
MRKIWQSDGSGGRLMRLTFVIATVIVSFFVVTHALEFVGASRLDADGGASIVALVSAAFTMYG